MDTEKEENMQTMSQRKCGRHADDRKEEGM